jgi:pyruvate carboxylase
LRGIPYRRQQNGGSPEIIKATMLKLLGSNFTQENVDALMTEFGATKSEIKKDFKSHPSDKEVYTKIDYTTVRDERDTFMTRYFDYAWVRGGIFWVFDSQGRFFDVYNKYGVCFVLKMKT